MEKVSPWTSVTRQLVLAASVSFLIGHFYGPSIIDASEHYWHATGDYMQLKWSRFLDTIGHNEFLLYVVGIALSIQISFWGLGCVFIYMDVTGRPKWARKYKIQQGTNEPLDVGKLVETVKVCLFNQWVVGTPLFVLGYCLKRYTDTIPPADELPTFARFAGDMLVMTVLDEFGLYYVHRLQHHPKLYSWVHKKHHEWPAPIAIVFVYSTVAEYLMNAIPVSMGPLLLNPHIVTLWSWYAFVHLRGLKNHSDYKFPWLPTNEEHDYHHMASNACYGKTIYVDWLHGTDKPFRAHLEKKKRKQSQLGEKSS